MRTSKGFTLIELITTAVILSILVAVALPSYNKLQERRYWRQAHDLLYAIYAGERAYWFANGGYFDVDETDATSWAAIHTMFPQIQSVPITFDVSVGGGAPPTTFTATATRVAGTFMFIDETGVLDTTNWPYP